MGISTIRFQNTITDKVIMYQDGSGNIGLGVTNGTLVIHTNDTATNISLGNNSSGSAFTGYNQKMLIGNAGTIINNNLTISGTLQSPMTSLLSVSSNIIDGKVGTIIGVSIPQFLTRNETILPSSFTTINVNDNLLIKSADTNNSYINFTDATYTSPGTNYVGMIGSNQRLYSQGNIDLYTNSGFNAMSANSSSMSINCPSTITYNLPGNTLNLTNTYGTFNNTMLGISTAVAAGTSAKFISGRANGKKLLECIIMEILQILIIVMGHYQI